MAEKIAQKLGPEPRKLNIGKSFDKRSSGGAAAGVYHGIRYDFKPVSIDDKREGRLEVGQNNSVTVSLPHVNGSGQTNYKGNLKPTSAKECVLIIDHNTGELTIEKISNQILMKKTRAEKPSSDERSGGVSLSQEEAHNPYQVKRVPDSNPYQVKQVPDKVPGHYSKKSSDSSSHHSKKSSDDPYAVKRVPDKPRHLEGMRPRKPSQSKEYDSDFSITPLNSAKSSPAQGPGSAKPSPTRQSVQGGKVDSLGRPLDSSSSSSSDSSDSDSDFDDKKDEAPAPAAPTPEPSSAASLFSMDFTSGSLPVQPQMRSGGVLPTARPTKHKKSSGHESSKYTSHSKIEIPAKQQQQSTDLAGDPNLLGDDLMLSDDESDID